MTEPSEELERVLATGGKRVSETFVLEYNPRETTYNLVCDPEPGNARANELAWAFDRLHTSRDGPVKHPYCRPPPNQLVDGQRQRELARQPSLRYLLEKRSLIPHLNDFDDWLRQSDAFCAKLQSLRKDLEAAYCDPHMATLRAFSQLLSNLERSVTFARSTIDLSSLPTSLWRSGDGSSLDVTLCIMRGQSGAPYSGSRFELDVVRNKMTHHVNHGVQLLCAVYEEIEAELYQEILNKKKSSSGKALDAEGDTLKRAVGKKMWGVLRAKVKKVVAGRQKAKQNVKIILLNKKQDLELQQQYHDLYSEEGTIDTKPILQEHELGEVIHILQGGGQLMDRADVVLLYITKEWKLHDILQTVDLARKKIVLVESHEDASNLVRAMSSQDTGRAMKNAIFLRHEKGGDQKTERATWKAGVE